MNEKIICLEKEIGKDLGQRSKIEEIFQNIEPNIAKVYMDFTNIEFIGRSFAQEYLNQKHFAHFEVKEINISEDIKKMLDFILELNGKQ